MKKETKIYSIEVENLNGDNGIFLSDWEFMDLAVKSGTVYTLVDFQNSFNADEVDSQNTIIRFINVAI